ncbi:MAG: phosphoglycolate phosphatase [Burkholderiaceae bacterium]
MNAREGTDARFAARAILIDLDGTLVETVPDLAAAVNGMRGDAGLPDLPISAVAAYVGKGATVLVQRALTGSMDGALSPDQLTRGLESFRRHYTEHNGRQSFAFEGTARALRSWRAAGLKLACVTNKPNEFTHALLEKLGLHDLFDVIVGGDDPQQKKPHPEPLLLACRKLGVAPADAVVVGDSINDLEAGRAAGCRVILVETGYNEGAPVSNLGADAIFPSLADATDLIGVIDGSSERTDRLTQ